MADQTQTVELTDEERARLLGIIAYYRSRFPEMASALIGLTEKLMREPGNG